MDRAAKKALSGLIGFAFWAAVGALAAAMVFFAVFRFTPLSLVNVHGPSMEPTFVDGDVLVIYNEQIPQRDQIGIFEMPQSWEYEVSEGSSKLIKRIVAIPGDRVTYEGNKMRIDSSNESYYLEEPNSGSCELSKGDSIELGPDEYMLAGDNRLQSFDSFEAWCRGLDPQVQKSSMSIAGDVKVALNKFWKG